MATGTPENDIILAAINTIDNRLDDIVGIRPFGTIADVVTELAPANVIEEVTGIDKPGVVAERIISKGRTEVRTRKGRLF